MGRMAIRKCGGFILAYLVTGFSGVCTLHFSDCQSTLTARPYKTFKQESIKKEGAAPQRSQRQTAANGTAPRYKDRRRVTPVL